MGVGEGSVGEGGSVDLKVLHQRTSFKGLHTVILHNFSSNLFPQDKMSAVLT